ncbi:acetolactate decarboxylase [Fructobacillus pseudoficulneus]|nr:acetolactate decarboxylase [Fructobacillus pseudoficulneus]SEH39845.1 acetolactate decarboxylase [Fructobacillus pseudoficulneus]
MSNSTLFQVGTMQLLANSLLDGTMSIGDLLKHGDFGIGTGQGLDGELIILDGKAYHTLVSGECETPDASFTTPFAAAHHGDFKDFGQAENDSLEEVLNNAVAALRAQNQFVALLVEGEFETMTTRSAAGSQKPYPSLTEAAEKQQVFNGTKVKGRLLSYYAPAIYQGVTVAGFHSHFLADDHNLSGHVLTGKVLNATVKVQLLDTIEQVLPVDNADFKAADLTDLTMVHKAIEAAE